MTTLTDRLAAIGVECGEVEEYLKYGYQWHSIGGYSVPKFRADAAIAALVNSLEHFHADNENMAGLLKSYRDDYVPQFVADGYRQRAEAAEHALKEAQDDNQRLRRLFGMMPRGEE